MKTIIIQYKEGERIDALIRNVLKIESSSKASLARRAILNYCEKVLNENKNESK